MEAGTAVRHPRLLLPSPGRAARHLRAPSTVRMALREDGPSVAIVGATGAVGQEFLRVITDRDSPYRSLVSRKCSPAAVASGAVVVDNSSAFRMGPEVPLVIPEVPEAMGNVRLGQGAIVANPNCSTIICLMAATPLHRRAKVLRMVVSTYQAASGAGAAAMEELKLQTQEVLEGKAPTCNIFKQQYAFNIFSHNAPVLENGYNEEEMKMMKETREIWNDKDVKVNATCIRVPVMRAHAESVNLKFEKALDEVSDKDDVAVDRILQDLFLDDNRGVGGGTEVLVKMHAYSVSVSGARLFLDSGATQHMVGDPSILCNIRDAPAGLTVITADGSILPITEVGDIDMPGFTIPDVWLVPGLKVCLISVRQLTDSGVCMLFIQSHVRLFLGLDLVGVADIDKSTGLYVLQSLRMPASERSPAA